MSRERDDFNDKPTGGPTGGAVPAGWPMSNGLVGPEWDDDIKDDFRGKPDSDTEANMTPAGKPTSGELILPEWPEQEEEEDSQGEK